jgi:hypothetical protein
MQQANLNLNGAHLARVYSLAVAYPDDVPGHVAENRVSLEPECMDNSFGRFFIERLRARALSGPNPDAVYNQAMQIASMAGAPQLGQQVANDFLKDRTDMLLLAGYLEDLISAIPAIFEGNTNAYQRTSLYGAMVFVWQSADGLVLPDFLQKLRQMAFELNEWYVNCLMDGGRFDYLDKSWPRTAKTLEDAVEQYESAKVDGDQTKQVVYAALILGTAMRYAPLLGLTEDDIGRMSSGLNVDSLVEWFQDNNWID